jgi:hypothetical protein
MSIVCELCPFSTSHKPHFDRHCQSEKHIHNQRMFDEMETKHKEDKAATIECLFVLEEENRQLRENNRELQRTIDNLRERADEYKSIVEKAALKATTVNNIKNTKTTNVLNLISPEPIDMKTFKTEMPKLITVESVLTNDKRFNNMIQSSLLQDENGKDKVVCTDIARKHFQYIDEGTGDLVSDPSLERLIDAMKKGVDYRKLSTELLEELNAIGGDPVENRLEAQRLMKRARFQTFPTHMAKKTYRRALAQITFDDVGA